MNPGTRSSVRLGLQAKILIAVLGLLVVVAMAMLWFVRGQIRDQMEEAAASTLASGQRYIQASYNNRINGLFEHFENEVAAARFQTMARLEKDDARALTLEQYLTESLKGAPEEREVLLFFHNPGQPAAAAARLPGFDVARFSAAITPSVTSALKGVRQFTSIAVGEGTFDVVVVPVRDAGILVGALAVGVRVTETSLRALQFGGTETFLVMGGRLAASTRSGLLDAANLADVLAASPQPKAIVLSGAHYLAAADALHPGQAGAQYVLVSNYEDRWKALSETRRTLIEISAVGMVLGGFVISWVVRRLTKPLLDLRDGAEAVGRGDFSRRIERISEDECGDLADAFNRMTANLENSRAELEKTVATLESTQVQLVQSEKLSAVGQFVAGVAHELNNPLTSVIGFSELLGSTTDDPNLRRQLDLITTSAHRCHKIVQSLLSFARQHPPERVVIQVNDTIDQVLEIMAYDLRTNNIAVVRDFQADLPFIEADPHQLQQVFVNILSNARQAIEPFRPDGRVTLRTRTRGPVIRIEFVDNGPGIRPENLSRIFDPFFTTKPVGKGTGLGMSLCYGIVREHNGRIVAESVFGQGATFSIELPVALQGGARMAPVPALRSASSSPFPAGKAVLIVDDEESIRQLGRVLLEREGYLVDGVGGGAEAIKLIETRQYDVIVCDWKMPGLSGIHLYEHLCSHNVVAASRMVFMTGDVVSDSFQAFLKRNGKRCLPKPFQLDDLRAVVGATVQAANE